MAMVALTKVRGALGPYIDDISAFAGGVLDAVFLEKDMDGAFLAKNIAIPILYALGLKAIPKGLVHQSEGMLGLIIAALLM